MENKNYDSQFICVQCKGINVTQGSSCKDCQNRQDWDDRVEDIVNFKQGAQ